MTKFSALVRWSTLGEHVSKLLPRRLQGLVLANVLAVGLGVVVIPVVTNVSSRAAATEFLLAQALLLALAPVAALRLDVRIPGARDRLEADALTSTALLAAIASSAVVVLMSGFFVACRLVEGSPPGFERIVLFLLPGAAALGATSALSMRCAVAGHFRAINRLRLGGAAAPAGAVILAAFLGAEGVWLVAADSVGRVAGLLTIATLPEGRMTLRRVLIGMGEPRRLLRTRGDVVAYTLQSTAAAAINSASVQAPLLVLANGFGANTAAAAALAMRLCALPSSVLGRAVAPSFVRDLNAVEGDALRDAVVLRYARVLAVVGLLCFVPLALLPSAWVSAVLGDSWRNAHPFIAPLSVFGFAQLVTAPLSATILAAGMHRHQLRWDILRAGALVAVAQLALFTGRSAVEVLLALVSVFVVFYVWQLKLVRVAAKSLTHARGRRGERGPSASPVTVEH